MNLSLRLQLESENSKLFIRLRNIETEARQLLEYSQAGDHAEFTPHGLSHISRVEQNAEVFLGEAGIRSLIRRKYSFFSLQFSSMMLS
jgi:hypothetical protein